MRLIDAELTRAQFDHLDPAVRDMLRTAMAADIRQWSGQLIDGWDRQDIELVRRARHALKGLTGNFGAEQLQALVEKDRGDRFQAKAVTECAEETIAAILEQSR